MKKLHALSTVTMALICAEAFAVDSPEFVYLQEKVAAYEHKLEECMRVGRNADLPSQAVLSALRAYPQEQVERFLVIRATLAEEQCVASELGGLATALLTIEAAEQDPSPDAVTLMHEIKPAAFTPARWELQRLYQSLPAEMREEMEEVEALQRPFNSLLIREYLYN